MKAGIFVYFLCASFFDRRRLTVFIFCATPTLFSHGTTLILFAFCEMRGNVFSQAQRAKESCMYLELWAGIVIISPAVEKFLFSQPNLYFFPLLAYVTKSYPLVWGLTDQQFFAL